MSDDIERRLRYIDFIIALLFVVFLPCRSRPIPSIKEREPSESPAMNPQGNTLLRDV